MQDDFPTGRRWHDLGGEAWGAIDRASHDFALWEKRVDALVILCGNKGLFTVDGLRRALEDMGPQAFEELGYYDRWVQACAQNLIECGVFSVDELNAKMAEVAGRGGGSTGGSANGAASAPWEATGASSPETSVGESLELERITSVKSGAFITTSTWLAAI